MLFWQTVTFKDNHRLMAKPPLVTVVVPNYNHRPFLPARLESIAAQSFTDYELLLLDDASNDGSVEYLKQFEDRAHVRLVLNETNSGGPFAQWNRGIREARGKYIWIAESDDTAEIQFLEKLVEILEGHPDVGIAACGITMIDEDGISAGPMDYDAFPHVRHRWTKDFLAKGSEEIKQFLYVQNTIPSASAVVFRRSLYQQAGDADCSLKLAGDWWRWVQMLLTCDLYYLAEPLACSRIHSSSQRQRATVEGRYELESLIVQNRIKGRLNVDTDTVRQGAQRCATSWLQAVRAGRYRGSLTGHGLLFCRLLRLNVMVAVRFLVRFPLCFSIWVARRTWFRHQGDGT